MPIRIDIHPADKPREEVAWLCGGIWELPAQIISLQKWLKRNHKKLDKGPYVADIGFSSHLGAAGGGAALTVETMKIMTAIDMELLLSEYPEFEEDEQQDLNQEDTPDLKSVR